jgi:hypothetical protein
MPKLREKLEMNMSVSEFRRAVQTGEFIDYDGFADVLDAKGKLLYEFFYPSMLEQEGLPENSHTIVWYNR